MKKYLFAILMGAFVLSSCEPEEKDLVTAEAVTLNVSHVSPEQFTLSATFTINGKKETPCIYGIFVGDEPGLQHGALITENKNASKPGTYPYTYVFNNQRGLVTPMYMYKPGTKVYYRAGIEVVTAEGGTWYYGEEKSFTVPAE